MTPTEPQVPQQPVTILPPPVVSARTSRSRLNITDLLEHLHSRSTEQLASNQDMDEEQKKRYAEVTRLTTELQAALAALEPPS